MKCYKKCALCGRKNIIISRMLVASWVALISCFITCVHGDWVKHRNPRRSSRDSVFSAYPTLLFATSKDIRIANVSRPLKVVTIVKELEEGAAVDFYYAGSLVCWTDHGLEMIQCVTYNNTETTNRVSVVTTDLISPDGLACDWLTKKLYWTDGETNRIEVTTLDGKYRKVLFWDDIDQPRAIAVVPMDSLLFWTDWGEVPKIERAGMNGDPATRKAIVSEEIFWPNGLTVDFDHKLVYWLDGRLNFIEVMDYDGRNRRKIAEKGVLYPFALALYQEKLYWTEWKTWSVHVLDLKTNGAPKEIIHGDYLPTDIKVWDARRQPYKPTPCDNNNGGCSHLCLLAPYPPGYTCACPTGVKLMDNYTCANGAQSFLLLVQRTDICWISLDSPDHTNLVIPLTGIKHAIAIDYDPIEGYLYWTDEAASAIRRAKLNGSGQEDLVTTEVKHPDGIAVDWIARNMYWTDTGTDRIEVARLTGQARKVLINEDLVEPRAIAVAPEKGWLFWSDWNDRRPKIERSSLDGSDRLILVKDGLGWPNGIALDLEAAKLYWCDAKTDKIEVINMNGTDRRELISDNLLHVFGLSLLGDNLYWTDWQRRSIDQADKNTGNARRVVADQLPNVMGIKAVGVGQGKGWNPCKDNNGGCSHLCLNRPKNDYVCGCQINYELATDQRTCVVPEAFLLFARRENIGRISIENAHNDAVIPVTGIKDASALDFDMSDSRIYWTDVKVKAITRAFINGSQVERIIEFGLDSPEGLAVDWVAHNIYWADTGSKRIEVARLNGSSRKVLLWSGIHEPHSIVLDPSEGYMYWSDWGDQGCIERAAMDGSRRGVFLAKIGRANGLTVDYAERRIYWAQLQGTASIEVADLDGKHRAIIINKEIGRPFALTQYQDYIYWADWNGGWIERIDKHTGGNRTRVHSRLDHVTDLQVFHLSRQRGWNQCAVSNGGCSHLCLAQPGGRQSETHRCACPTHYTLNNTTCSAPTSFILYSQRNSLNRLLWDTDDCPDSPLPIQGLKNVRSVEFDPLSQFLYWIDGKTQSIRRSLDSGHSAGVLVSGSGALHHHPYDLAIDPYTRLLYWSCAAGDTINVTRLDNGSALGVVVRGVDGEKPRNIALHPERGYLYWTDVGLKPRVMGSRLDGQKQFVVAVESETVTGLAVDRVDNMLYWSTSQKIQTSDLIGKDRRSVIVYPQQISSIAVLGSYLYWSDKEQQVIERVDKNTGLRSETVIEKVPLLTDLVAVIQPLNPNHPCGPLTRHGSCTHLCLPTPHGSSECSCPAGLILHEDRTTCSALPACGPDHFACGTPSADCVPTSWRCDGQADCPNSSDEMGCPDCRPEQFRCSSGQCIDLNWQCDGNPQCPDGSDESSCCHGLPDSVFQCAIGVICVPTAAVCDGLQHCPDGSDETPLACSARRSVETVQNSPPQGHLTLYILIIVSCLASIAAAVYRCRKRFASPSPGLPCEGDSAADPLSPKPTARVTPKVTTNNQINKPVAIMRMSNLNGGSSSSYERSHTTGASSSASLLCYPLNPPPSPATTAQREDYCCPKYLGDYCRPPPPTPCSTDVCDESDSNYRCDSDPYPPPPTPRSHSSGPPSPSSSTYFHPLPPPPSPSGRCNC